MIEFTPYASYPRTEAFLLIALKEAFDSPQSCNPIALLLTTISTLPALYHRFRALKRMNFSSR